MDVQEARVAGCRSSGEADRYLEQKRRREAEDRGHRKENSHAGPSSQESLNVPVSSDSLNTYSNTTSVGHSTSASLTDLDFVSLSGADLLSESVSMQFLLLQSKSSLALGFLPFN